MKGMESSSDPAVAVLFDVDLDYATAVYQGVRDALGAGAGWPVLPLAAGSEAALGALRATGRLKGLIGSFVSDKWIRDQGLGPIPVVNIGNLSDIRSVDAVTPDDRAAGVLAGRALAESGLRRFGFAGLSGVFHSRLRHEGFLETVKAAGGTVSCAPMVGLGGAAAAWRAWLEGLDGPVGVYAATDYHARLLLELCRDLGRAVPGDVAVIGTGNALLQGVFAPVALSSVELPGRAVGRAAALQLLARSEGRCGGAPVRRWIAPLGVLHRASSACHAGADPVVARAEAHIRQHLAAPLDVAAVARGIGVSRRLLELRFRAVLKRSPYREILRRRMEKAAYLLQNTSLRIHEVGAACGFPEPHHFSAVFKRWHGRPPTAFRV